MSATVYTDIRAALEQRLSSLPGLPAVAWENVKYTPVVGTPYLEPIIMWAEATQAEIGVTGRNWERGIYQITAVYPLDKGSSALEVMTGNIREWFKRGTELQQNGLTVKVKNVYPGPRSTDNAGVRQPISIVFFCQTPN